MNRRPSFTVTPKPCPDTHARFLGRCSFRGCDFCKAADLPTFEKTHDRQPPLTFTTWPAEQRELWWKTEGTYTTREANPGPLHAERCKIHDRPLRWTRIEGRFSETRKCDPRCTGAIGPNCDCQCGGANHGCDHL